MSMLETVPTTTVESLCATIDALRGETGMLKATGGLAVDVDDLLDGGGVTQRWLAEAATQAAMTDARHVRLPGWEPGMLQQVVYTLSAVLVWAHEMWKEGRIATCVPMEALHAWDMVERSAGLGGRTSAAIGRPTMRAGVRSTRGDERFVSFLARPPARQPGDVAVA